MIKIYKNGSNLEVLYRAESLEWLIQKLEHEGKCPIVRAFTITPKDILNIDEIYLEESTDLLFTLGTRHGSHYKISKDILDTDYDVYFDINLEIKNKYFFESIRHTPTLKHIVDTVQADIYVDNEDTEEPNHIPIAHFEKLIKSFPNNTEIQKYIKNRIATLVEEYCVNAQKRKAEYEEYLNKKHNIKLPSDEPLFNELKLDLLNNAYKRMHDMLPKCENFSENDWQEEVKNILCGIFPNYIYALRKINVGEQAGHDREPDYILISSDGYVDVMEIKKPDEQQVMRTAMVRNNFVPIKLFTDVVVQTSKYLLAISGNIQQTKRNIWSKLKIECPATTLTEDKIQINNPKGIILFGRSNELSAEMRNDFELIKRQYKDIAEIMTYDDLLARMKNLIDALSQNQHN